MPYRYPNPPRLSVYTILRFLQAEPERVYRTIDLINKFDISPSDAAVRMTRLRSMGFIKFHVRLKRRKEYILTDYGKRFKK